MTDPTRFYNNFSAYDIIRQAFQIIGVIGTMSTETIDDGDIKVALDALNAMIKALEANGTRLFQKNEATLFLNAGQNRFILGDTVDGSDVTIYAHATENFNTTQLTAVAAIGTTIIAVDTSSEVSVNDFIAVVVNGNNYQWSTVKSKPDTTHIELNDALTTAASNNAYVYSYTYKIEKPLNVYEGRRQNTSLIDTPMWLMSHKQWTEQPNKLVQSTPVSLNYQPKSTFGYLYIWPTASTDAEYKVNFTYDRQIEIFENTLDKQDFPNEWSEAIIYQLAVRLAPRYGKLTTLDRLKPLADELLKKMEGFDNESGSVYVQPAADQSMFR